LGRIASLTALAMIAFAANSVLARLALLSEGSNPIAYTGLRLASGAAMLALLVFLRNRQRFAVAGSWAGAAALLGYAIAFSVAYIVLGAGTGALILFATVQISIVGWAIIKGDRPTLLEWIGLAVALAGLAYLVSPGLVAPPFVGALLMFAAGLCWTGYTLLGRGSHSPLADTTGNFIRCLPIALPLIVIGAFWRGVELPMVGYAIASGAIASGLGYAVWYAVLPSLTRTRAAIVQLTVPAIAAAGGVLLIAEPISDRLIIASIAILGGVGFALVRAGRRK
jgi:drug/metabolite transporter (DMT)-like permease